MVTGQKKEVARQTPAELQKARGQMVRLHAVGSPRRWIGSSRISATNPAGDLPRLLARGRKLFRHGAKEFGMAWSPRIDVHERDGKFIVHADLPGMTKDEVKVEIFDDMLTIEGERKHEKNEEREGYSYSECSYGSFYRSVPSAGRRRHFESNGRFPQGRARGDDAGCFDGQAQGSADRNQRRQVSR